VEAFSRAARLNASLFANPDPTAGCLAGQVRAGEVEVLRLMSAGQSDRQVSDQLAIRAATAQTHVSHILTKLDLSSRTQAALYALREGLASLDGTDPPGEG
jgi:DNA-binding NarL/FixJ family response regulator